MINCVENFLIDYNIKDTTAIVGFSGGPDSCALALLLNSLKEKYNLTLILAYFNHGWREEAKNEETFTKEFAKKLNLKYLIKKAPSNEKKTEENARKLRYEFFENCCNEFNSNVVFLAHNKNDNIETLIYRLIKGTSLKGLTSIPKKRGVYYRPLLKVEKSQILDYLNKNKQTFMFDSSNNDTKYKRNFIRNKILPLFSEINENYINNIDILIENLNAAQEIVNEKITEVENKIIINSKINQTEFLKLSRAYSFEILNNFLKNYLKTRDYKTLLKIYNFILNNKNSKISISKKEYLIVKNNLIYIERKIEKDTSSLLINSEGTFKFKNFCLTIRKIKTEDICTFPKSNELKCYLELDFSTPYVLRHRKDGDIFIPFGFKQGKTKLKNYLIDKKYSQNQKDELILLCKENEVFWIVKEKPSEKCRVKNNVCYELTGVFENE